MTGLKGSARVGLLIYKIEAYFAISSYRLWGIGAFEKVDKCTSSMFMIQGKKCAFESGNKKLSLPHPG